MGTPGFVGRWSIKLLVIVAAVFGAYLYLVRPWFLRWGATDSEICQTWPGDDLAPAPAYVATRAITIKAPAELVWRWVVQVGQDRAGFYSYTWLENLFQADMHNANYVHEEWQTRNIGDTVWLTRRDRYHGSARQNVALVTPNRAMVLVSPADYQNISGGGSAQGSWAFIIVPVEPRVTRLILRSRAGSTMNIWQKAFAYLLFDPAHFIMERKMMLSIKHRSEECVGWLTLYGNQGCPGN